MALVTGGYMFEHDALIPCVGNIILSYLCTLTDISSGGLVRNVLAPLFSRGSTICCPAFDPSLFWDVVETLQPTWYYASPTMHSLVLAQGASRPKALERSRFRLVCNAAGGLLPSLAQELSDIFKCAILPSYGMTEYVRTLPALPSSRANV